MNVSEKLMNEHQLILGYIKLIKKITEKDKNDVYVLENGKDLIDFIQNYADRYHHAQEEKILFRYMDRPGAFAFCNPVPQMLTEHDEGRGYVGEMIKALEQNESERFCSNALKYGNLLVDHITKEDEILYPMAEKGLTDTDKENINKEYNAAELELNKMINLDNYYQERLGRLEKSLNN